MIEKILVSDVDSVVLLLLTNFKQNLKVQMKDSNTDFITNLSNLCEKILEIFNMKRFWDQKNQKLYTATSKITNCEVILLLFFPQPKYREVWDKDKTSVHIMPDTPEINLARANALNVSKVSTATDSPFVLKVAQSLKSYHWGTLHSQEREDCVGKEAHGQV